MNDQPELEQRQRLSPLASLSFFPSLFFLAVNRTHASPSLPFPPSPSSFLESHDSEMHRRECRLSLSLPRIFLPQFRQSSSSSPSPPPPHHHHNHHHHLLAFDLFNSRSSDFERNDAGATRATARRQPPLRPCALSAQHTPYAHRKPSTQKICFSLSTPNDSKRSCLCLSACFLAAARA